MRLRVASNTQKNKQSTWPIDTEAAKMNCFSIPFYDLCGFAGRFLGVRKLSLNIFKLILGLFLTSETYGCRYSKDHFETFLRS